MQTWTPSLPVDAVPLYRRLVDALERDILDGTLPPGQKLPPHRDLAHRLSISVGSVTRAYEEAAARGLVDAHVGRGSFVRSGPAQTAQAQGSVDLGLNVAPIDAEALLARAGAELKRFRPERLRLDYLPVQGLAEDREALAAWLQRTANFAAPAEHILCTNGAQAALAVAMAALCRPGEAILCEALTFPGMKALASAQGYRLIGVDMDAEGMIAESLARAARESGARTLYVLPTLQNPSARIMSAARRRAIVETARELDLAIVEDDVYAAYTQAQGLSPLAALAPERCLHLGSVSKIIAPGLRCGYIVAAETSLRERCLAALRAFAHSPPGLTFGLLGQLIRSGEAFALAGRAVAEAGARVELARKVFDGLREVSPGARLHLWLPGQPQEVERAVLRAASRGVRVNSGSAFAVSGQAFETGLRICLGSAGNRESLERALAIVRDALADRYDGNLDPEL